MTEPVATYRRPLIRRWWYHLTKVVAWATTKLYFRYRYRGGEHVPRTGPVVVLCNHQSTLDPLLVGIASPRQLGFLARDTLFVGWFASLLRSFDAIPIDREGASLSGIRAMLARLRRGDAILMFPEGTRTSDGEFQPLKPGFGPIVRRSGAAILPAALDGAFQALRRGQKLPSPSPIALAFGEPLSASQIAQMDDQQLQDEVRRRISHCLHQARLLRGAAQVSTKTTEVSTTET